MNKTSPYAEHLFRLMEEHIIPRNPWGHEEVEYDCPWPETNDKASGPVNHPGHYNQGKFEVIDVIEDWKLGFNLGNVVKYIARADHKGATVQDLKKALWYLEREISSREAD